MSGNYLHRLVAVPSAHAIRLKVAPIQCEHPSCAERLCARLAFFTALSLLKYPRIRAGRGPSLAGLPRLATGAGAQRPENETASDLQFRGAVQETLATKPRQRHPNVTHADGTVVLTGADC
jgi:hypothetical protein